MYKKHNGVNVEFLQRKHSLKKYSYSYLAYLALFKTKLTLAKYTCQGYQYTDGFKGTFNGHVARSSGDI